MLLTNLLFSVEGGRTVAIDVGHGAAAKVGLLARAWKVMPGKAVERLLHEFEAGSGLR